MSLSVQSFLAFAEADVQGAEGSAHKKKKRLSCRTFHPAGASGQWLSSVKGLAGIFSYSVGFILRPRSSTPIWKPVRKGLCGLVGATY